MFRCTRHPLVSCALLLCLGYEAWSVAESQGSSIYLLGHARASDCEVSQVWIVVAKRDGVWRHVKFDPSDVEYATARLVPPRTYDSGFWWPTSRRTICAIDVRPNRDLSDQDVREIRGVVCDDHRSIGGAVPEGVQQGDVDATRVLWRGVARNAADLLLLAAFVLSLGWLARLPHALRARLFITPVGHLCSSCRYDLSGLVDSPNPRCPECGLEQVTIFRRTRTR